MGLYDDGQFRSSRRRIGGSGGSGLKWVAVAAVAALVGSGTTLGAVLILMQNNVIAAPIQANANLQNASYHVNQPMTMTINDAIVKAVKKVTPSVVGVINFQMIQGNTAPILQEVGVGSGVIFGANGYIVTNNHVVEGASKVEVVLDNRKHVYAKVVGTDAYTDLAVLKIPQSYVTPQDVAQFGNSSSLQPGEPAIAIGNPAGLDFADSVTVGVISATQRTMPVQDVATGQVLGEETVLQTDAAINPGNSGGPLCNAAGQVIGINSSKIVAKGFEGMGFAIPINEVRTVARQIVETGHALHPALGIEGQSLTSIPQQYQPNVPVNYGVWVYKVDSAAAKASGIEHGDVIVAIDGKKVTGFSDLRMVLWNNYKPGDTITVTFYRGQQKETVSLKLGELPPLPNQAPPSVSGNGSGGSFVIPNPFGGGSGSGSGGGGGLPFP